MIIYTMHSYSYQDPWHLHSVCTEEQLATSMLKWFNTNEIHLQQNEKHQCNIKTACVFIRSRKINIRCKYMKSKYQRNIHIFIIAFTVYTLTLWSWKRKLYLPFMLPYSFCYWQERFTIDAGVSKQIKDIKSMMQ